MIITLSAFDLQHLVSQKFSSDQVAKVFSVPKKELERGLTHSFCQSWLQLALGSGLKESLGES